MRGPLAIEASPESKSKEPEMWMEPPQRDFDGEEECPECAVVICAFCQGFGFDGCKGVHKHDCSFVKPRKYDRPGLTAD